MLQYYGKKLCNALKVKEITRESCKLQAASCKSGKQPKAENREYSYKLKAERPKSKVVKQLYLLLALSFWL